MVSLQCVVDSETHIRPCYKLTLPMALLQCVVPLWNTKHIILQVDNTNDIITMCCTTVKNTSGFVTSWQYQHSHAVSLWNTRWIMSQVDNTIVSAVMTRMSSAIVQYTSGHATHWQYQWYDYNVPCHCKTHFGSCYKLTKPAVSWPKGTVALSDAHLHSMLQHDNTNDTITMCHVTVKCTSGHVTSCHDQKVL